MPNTLPLSEKFNNRNLREEAINFLNEKLKNINLQRHCFAVEAIMRGLAKHYGESEEIWGLTGLIHDIDYELTENESHRHGLVGAEWLQERGYPPEVVRAVKVHNWVHGLPLETRMERALVFADAMSGLIVAAALVTPSKKLTDLEADSVLKRFRQGAFARRVNREEILRCEAEGLPLPEFAELSIRALQGIADKLGL